MLEADPHQSSPRGCVDWSLISVALFCLSPGLLTISYLAATAIAPAPYDAGDWDADKNEGIFTANFGHDSKII